MASPPSSNPSDDPLIVQDPISSYPRRIWRTLLSFIPSPDSSFLARISNLYSSGPSESRQRRRRPGLPLPLRSSAALRAVVTSEKSRAFVILEDIMDHTLSSLHNIQKSLLFWQSRAEGTDTRKVYFMLFERGPRAFVDETFQVISRRGTDGFPLQYLSHSAAETISDKISVLTSIQRCLATFLAQVYLEVDKYGQLLTADSDNSLPALLVTINNLFANLEASISHPHEIYQSHNSFSLEDGQSCALLLEKIPDIDQERSQWTDTEIRDATSAIYKNLQRLDSYLSFIMISIRDELFETFRRRHKGVMEVEEVQLTANSLHRMLLAFSEQIKGQKFPENTADQEMLEIVMARYEKEVMHPLQNLLSGELARAMLIQIQKLKLDLETAMLELNQILKANEINFAILAALPAFFLSLLLLVLVRTWIHQDKGAEGRGRVARLQRRLLLVEVEKRIMKYHNCIDQGLEEEGRCMFGLVLYSLDRLYKAVERHARATGEWLSLREDIGDLGKPELKMEHKLAVTSRLANMYDCLLPSRPR